MNTYTNGVYGDDTLNLMDENMTIPNPYSLKQFSNTSGNVHY